MATAGELATAVYGRIRDPLETAHPRWLVIAVLSEAQRLVNASTRALLGEAAITVGIHTGQYEHGMSIINVPAVMPLAIRVETVRDDVRDLTKVNWRHLPQADRGWLKRTGGAAECWAHFSPSRVIVYPTPDKPTLLHFVYTRLTAPLIVDADVIELPDVLHPAMLDMVEEVLLARQRLFVSVPPATAQLTVDLGATSR